MRRLPRSSVTAHSLSHSLPRPARAAICRWVATLAVEWKWKQRVLERRSRRPVRLAPFLRDLARGGSPAQLARFDLRPAAAQGTNGWNASSGFSSFEQATHGRYLARSKLRRTGAATCLFSGPTHKVVGLSVNAVLPRSAITARPSEELSLMRGRSAVAAAGIESSISSI